MHSCIPIVTLVPTYLRPAVVSAGWLRGVPAVPGDAHQARGGESLKVVAKVVAGEGGAQRCGQRAEAGLPTRPAGPARLAASRSGRAMRPPV